MPAILDCEQAFRDLVVALQQELGADRCTLYVLDRETSQVRSIVALGLEAGEIRLGIQRGLVGSVARTGRTLNLRDAYNDPRFDRSWDRATGYRTKSVLTMAIRGLDNQVIGVLQALNKASGTFTAEDEAATVAVCRAVAQLMEADA